MVSLGRAWNAYGMQGPPQSQSDAEEPPPWGDPSTLVTAIAVGTVAVPDVADLVEAYCDWFAYVEHRRGSVPAALADFWDAPAPAGHSAALVGPHDMNRGLIRFVEIGSEFKRIPPFTTLGWTALEIRARNVDKLVSQLEGGPFVSPTGPHDLKFGDSLATLRAVQFRGPTGELLPLRRT